jgi:hypothetical protein
MGQLSRQLQVPQLTAGLQYGTWSCSPDVFLFRADQPAKQGVKRKAVRKPRPKVNIEDLRKDFGLKHLVDVFPAQFRTVFRGHGHEVCWSVYCRARVPC